ncbi:MAG: RloB domain-containing protein [Thiohalocapsa sp. PB-PSB1]|jgi:hypothetical protein|nr:MAG: hypothetical protein N838_09525 [Thiohalocapsa sp. PB-PSB1]QQO52068.1 MAG: RloB domain-containing protein [Thiohalocapsa sp. PB-PSB1]
MALTSRKARPLDRSVKHLRDTRLIIIAAEGALTEKLYFEMFRSTRVQLRVLPTGDDGQSAPEHVLARLIEFREEFQLAVDDALWLMIDVDRPETVGTVLGYLREYRVKLTARLEHLKTVEASVDASRGEKTLALKDIEKLKKVLDELDTYERDVLYPLATQRIEIDLDDGVKHNYPLFGAALKKIPGLSP